MTTKQTGDKPVRYAQAVLDCYRYVTDTSFSDQDAATLERLYTAAVQALPVRERVPGRRLSLSIRDIDVITTALVQLLQSTLLDASDLADDAADALVRVYIWLAALQGKQDAAAARRKREQEKEPKP